MSSISGTYPINVGAIKGTTITGSSITATAGFTSSGGAMSFANMGNQGAGSYNTDGTLSFAHNLSNGQDEFDIIAINSLTTQGLAIYIGDATTPVTNATVPPLRIYISGIRPTAIYDSTNSAGNAGQVLSAGGAGGSLLWIDPA